MNGYPLATLIEKYFPHKITNLYIKKAFGTGIAKTVFDV
jgi:hypothetical protein